MKKHRFLAAARGEYLETLRYYKRISSDLASSFHTEFAKVRDFAKRHPEAGHFFEKPVRRLLVDRFPYGFFYVLRDDEITIVSVMHNSRHPDYWKDRIKDIPP